jgi:ABC-type multidrug transport system ATPase subunit
VIELDRVAARRRPLALASVSLHWGAGVHAVLGRREDGGALLLALIAGAARPRSGRVTVLGGAPDDASVRTRVAVVPLDPTLPDALRVGEAMVLAAAIRGEPAREPSDRLRVLGIESLAKRPVRSLSLAEARAVALAEAVTSSRVRVLLVEEPLVAMDPRASGLLPEQLRARGTEGCAVVLLTASHRDAGDLADDHVLIERGGIITQAASTGARPGASPAEARLRVVAQDSPAARAIVVALALDETVEGVAQEGASIVARGRDAVALARCVGRAIVEAGVDVAEIRCEPPLDPEGREVTSAGAWK